MPSTTIDRAEIAAAQAAATEWACDLARRADDIWPRGSVRLLAEKADRVAAILREMLRRQAELDEVLEGIGSTLGNQHRIKLPQIAAIKSTHAS